MTRSHISNASLVLFLSFIRECTLSNFYTYFPFVALLEYQSAYKMTFLCLISPTFNIQLTFIRDVYIYPHLCSAREISCFKRKLFVDNELIFEYLGRKIKCSEWHERKGKKKGKREFALIISTRAELRRKHI